MKNIQKFIGLLLIIVCICLAGCKAGAGAAIPITGALDTALAPFQLMGNAGTGLINMGDRHQVQVYEANKDSTTLPLSELTTLIFYIPGYLLLPFDSITPDDYYSLTKSCFNTINAKPEKEKKIRKYKALKTPNDDFEEW